MDPNTGEFISEDQTGLILRSDGTYYLRAEFGLLLTEERGRYFVQGNQVRITFSDGSGITLTLEDGGKRLNWYDNGNLSRSGTTQG